ncbi:hypothetical protein [Couchioplanes caeruleus]|nr:hypothetical protein [Couchioplanes caeruleus]ROP33482.1 hypothetical protein EDD30_6468 [Couchioplanes caeruleus]
MAWWGRRPSDETPVGRATAVVASAARMRYDSAGSVRRIGRQEWQDEAWRHYEECGELSYIVDLIAKAMSRSRLYITQLDEHGDPIESPDTAPGDINDTFLGGPSRQAELLHEVGVQLGVPGECYLIGEPERNSDGRTGDRERWLIASTDELQERSGQYLLDQGDGARELVADETVIVRIWVPSPRKHQLPKSQVQANRRVLRLIERLSQYVQSQIDSRLAGAGILLLPNELSFVPSDQQDQPDDGVSSFLAALTEAMTTAVRDRDSVAALVPIVVQGPAEHLEKARLLSFATELSASVPGLLDGAIRRLALGLDVPPEVLLGMAETNHWSAWQLDEATIKYHVESKLELLCAALTQQMLWPALDGVVDDPRSWVVWYDTSELTQAPDRGSDAKDLFDRGELSGKALRRETGFSDNDAPEPGERELRRLLEIVRTVPAAGPALVTRLLELAGVTADVDVQHLLAPPPPVDEPTPSAEDPAPVQDPDRAPPDRDQASITASAARVEPVVAACEALVLKALELAGKRILGRQRYQHRDLPSWEYHTVRPQPADAVPRLLSGAFATVPTVAPRLGVDAEALTVHLSAYVGGLLVSGARHDPDTLREHLAGAVGGELVPA